MTPAPPIHASLPASQNTGSGWSVVIFFVTQFAQIAGGVLVPLAIPAISDPIKFLSLLVSWPGFLFLAQMIASSLTIILTGYLLIFWITGYPLIAMVIAGFWRRRWAAEVHLAVTLLAGQIIATGWFSRFDHFLSGIQLPLIIGPLVGYVVFRALAGTRPPGTVSLSPSALHS